MARPKRNSNRRSNSSARKAKPSRQAPRPAPSPPSSAPRQPIAPRRGVPPNSAQARAQRAQNAWDSALDTGKRSFSDIFGRELLPTAEQRQQRDEQLAQQPNVVQMDPMEWWALEMARQGNDVYLFDYQPTPSSNPPRPRTLAAGYHDSTRTLRVRFRNGQVYGYYRVPPNVWRQFKRQESIGRFINRVLNHYPYAPERDLDQPTGLT
ncbi:hypothetical protein GCM10010149_87930 [Nonomuraea roseoviolacea subsp. roseoviolacea]|uniref:KTSC domain-containing protein n=1 Tax=Nonomuraea roseoviolacea TaxID=103837 RepID=UPI0031CFAE5B